MTLAFVFDAMRIFMHPGIRGILLFLDQKKHNVTTVRTKPREAQCSENKQRTNHEAALTRYFIPPHYPIVL